MKIPRLALVLFLVAAATARAQEPTPPAPAVPARFEPAPDNFDWIQFKSGEWIKGELVALYNGVVDFDSDQLGVMSFDWDDVRRLRTARVTRALLTGQRTVSGRIVVVADTVLIVGAAGEQRFARGELITIAGGEQSERRNWSGKITLGANLRRGNTEQLELNGDARATRRTVRSRIGLSFLGNYNMTNDVKAADNMRANVEADWFLTDRLFVRPIEAEYFRDPFQNINSRVRVGAALGYELVGSSRIDWNVSAGPAYESTNYQSVQPGETDPQSNAAVSFRTTYSHELTSRIDYRFDYGFFVTKPEAGKYSHHLVTGFSVETVASIDLEVSVVWDRVQMPRAASNGTIPKQDDLRFIFGLGVEF